VGKSLATALDQVLGSQEANNFFVRADKVRLHPGNHVVGTNAFPVNGDSKPSHAATAVPVVNGTRF